MLESKSIFTLWQQGKLSTEVCLRDLARSRCLQAQKFYTCVLWSREKQSQISESWQVQHVLSSMEASLQAFRAHPLIDAWLQSYQVDLARPTWRFKCLLLRGRSLSGKSQKGMSLFGIKHTLVLNCQGCVSALPDLKGFDRLLHKALLFDEVDHRLVLGNKLLFQAGPVPLALCQSACQQHVYHRWFFRKPMVLCSNIFQLDESSNPDSLVSKEDSDWLRANIVEVCLPDEQTWFVS